MTTPTVVFGVIAALGGIGGVVSLLLVSANRSKIRSEARLIGVNADDVLSGRALQMYDRAMTEAGQAKEEAHSCRTELRALRRHVDLVEDHVDTLSRQMRDAGLEPPPPPAPFVWPVPAPGGAS